MQSTVIDALRCQSRRQVQGWTWKSCALCRRSSARLVSTSHQDRSYYYTSASWNHRTSPLSSAPAAAQLLMLDSSSDDDDDPDETADHHLLRNWELLLQRQISNAVDMELGERANGDTDGMDDLGEDDNNEDLDPQPTFKELLRNFDPINPPQSTDPVELQLWIESQAHQEGLLKYQQILDAARHRKDYAALSAFQTLVLRWFSRLRDAIALLQSEYVLKKGDTVKTSLKRYGPFLCALSAEKLAVITAHEALLLCLLHPGKNGVPGVPLLTLAERIGQAVEQELLVQRLLHKRSVNQREWKKKRAQQESTIEEASDNELGEADGDAKDFDVETVQEDSLPGDVEDKAPVDGAPQNWTYASSHLKSYLEELSKNDTSLKKRRTIQYAIQKAQKVFDTHEWSAQDKIGLGVVLFHCLLENSEFSMDGDAEPAFVHELIWQKNTQKKTQKSRGMVILNQKLHNRIVLDKLSSISTMTNRYKPMILPPKPWKTPTEGGYLWLEAKLMRYRGSQMQKEALDVADLSTLYQGLNVLGQVPWKINKRILDVAWQCWEQNVALGDIPTQTDFTQPDQPVPPPYYSPDIDRESPAFKEIEAQWKVYGDAMTKYKRIKQKNMDLTSLRCSARLKLDQAEKFKDFDKIYFPYNVDFRGRAYPIPPHLSNVGSDLCRGLLMFSKAKPLGGKGFFWLKVHLANLAGMDKMTFEDRAAFVDKNIDKVRQCAEDPFGGDRWWMEFEDPFQGLATCIEIVQAIDSGDPESYMCALPVHMDGSCNGLQHYAALGRDRIGGRAVNLCSDKEPQDVYIGVMHEVIRRVAEETKRELDFDYSEMDKLSQAQRKQVRNHKGAQLVHGLIDRGVVKRTVMTSVYGVTFIGARNQIEEKIKSKLESQGYDIDEMEDEVFGACNYLAGVTMQAVGDLFVGAKETMDWLSQSARLITQHGYPVAWISPIGVPAIQPYRQKKSSTIVTLMQVITLVDQCDDLPLHKQRQVSAFPPNYVHSLDSSHMLLTALEMNKRGLDFSAVHDSFWTHACDIEEMNATLRDVFVKLYSRPLLEELKASWEIRYPDLEFPELPKHGELKLEEVRAAPYFFQ